MTRYFFILLFGAAALLAGATGAAEPQQDIRDMLGRLRGQVVKAEVFAVSIKWSFRRRMSEADLPEIGCLYRFDEPAAVESLMEALASAPIAFAGAPAAPLDVRVGVYLHANDGTTAKLVFGRTDKQGDVRGIYDGTIPFVAREPFDWQVRALLGRLTPATVHYQCDRDDIPLVSLGTGPR